MASLIHIINLADTITRIFNFWKVVKEISFMRSSTFFTINWWCRASEPRIDYVQEAWSGLAAVQMCSHLPSIDKRERGRQRQEEEEGVRSRSSLFKLGQAGQCRRHQHHFLQDKRAVPDSAVLNVSNTIFLNWPVPFCPLQQPLESQ